MLMKSSSKKFTEQEIQERLGQYKKPDNMSQESFERVMNASRRLMESLGIEFRLNLERMAEVSNNRTYKCLRCKDEGSYVVEPAGEHGAEVRKICECVKCGTAPKIDGLPYALTQKSFDNYNCSSSITDNAKSIAVDYVMKFKSLENHRCNSIVFMGQSGAGKTHLASAISNVLIKNNIPVTYMNYRQDITELKQVVTDVEYYARIMGKFKRASVLFIDDLLKGKPTDTDRNYLFEILDYRYLNYKPVIITTEHDIATLSDYDEAIAGRIYEMCAEHSMLFPQNVQLNFRF